MEEGRPDDAAADLHHPAGGGERRRAVARGGRGDPEPRCAAHGDEGRAARRSPRERRAVLPAPRPRRSRRDRRKSAAADDRHDDDHTARHRCRRSDRAAHPGHGDPRAAAERRHRRPHLGADPRHRAAGRRGRPGHADRCVRGRAVRLLRRRRRVRQSPRDRRLRRRRSRGRAPCAGLRDAPPLHRSAPRPRRGGGRARAHVGPARSSARRVRLRVDPRLAHAGDASPDRRAGARSHEADGVSRQRRARSDRGRAGSAPRPLRAAHRRRGARCLRERARINPRLFALPNVVLSPHVGSAIRELRDAMANLVVDNILAVLDGKPPPNCWNPEIYAAR